MISTTIITDIFVFVFGLLIGSFLNAVIYRLPREISIVYPRSACPHCKKTIYWYENIPVISFLFLRGRCSGCAGSISWRYPAIELAMGIIAFLLFPAPLTTTSLVDFIFLFSVACVFVVHFFVDLDYQILPDGLNLYLAIVFFGISWPTHPWTHWLLGGLLGFFFPLAVAWVFYKLRGQIGLGGGDIKLYGALGLYLGPLGVMYNIFLSCLLGSVVGVTFIALKKMERNNPIPFGPFILITAAIQIYFSKAFDAFSSFLF